MKEKEVKISPEEVVAAVQASGNGGVQGNELLDLMYKTLRRQLDRQEEIERQERETQKANALMLEAARQEELRRQESCSHLKPNNTSNIVGQWDHQGVTHYMCQMCQKMWTGHTLPAYLRPPEEAVGGPVKIAKT